VTEEPTYEIVTSRRVRLRDGGNSELLYRPSLEQLDSGYFEIKASTRNEEAWTWGFWGLVLVAGAFVSLLVRAPNIFDFWSVITEIIGVTLGLLLYRFGRRTKLEEGRVGALDFERGVLHLDRGEISTVRLDEIVELVFGMTHYPVEQHRPDARIHAFTFLIRREDGDLVPVVEASPQKAETFDVANAFSEMLDLPVTYVGKGIKDEGQ
jgi:hypothetical protein